MHTIGTSGAIHRLIRLPIPKSLSGQRILQSSCTTFHPDRISSERTSLGLAQLEYGGRLDRPKAWKTLSIGNQTALCV